MGRIKKRYLDLSYPNGLTASDINVDVDTKIYDHLIKSDIKFSYIGSVYSYTSDIKYDLINNIKILKLIVRTTSRGDDNIVIELLENDIPKTPSFTLANNEKTIFDLSSNPILFSQDTILSYKVTVTPNTTTSKDLYITVIYI